MRRTVFLLGVLGSLVIGSAAWWRRHPRFGSAWVNRVIDPWLVGQGIVESSDGEIGLIEHVGRTSGIVRLTPIHPVPTEGGFRIVVPLGLESQWARNVLAAGRCRMQVADIVHELDEPVLIAPAAVPGMPSSVAAVMDWLGFRYLVLHQVAEAPGSLTMSTVEAPDRQLGLAPA